MDQVHKANERTTLRAEDMLVLGPDGKPIEIPVDGSLGLLALGYKGLMAWRAKRVHMVASATKGSRA